MPARKHNNNETSYQYTLRMQREKNEDFNKILNSNNSYIEKLATIKTFNNTTKFTQI